jgi:hypothetical protein
MHLENRRPATSPWTRCAGVGAKPPSDLTPPPLGLDEDDRLPDLPALEMLATPRLEPPQPAIRTAMPTSTTRAARPRGSSRRRWRALTVSAGRMVNGSFASTLSNYMRGRLNLVTATARSPNETGSFAAGVRDLARDLRLVSVRESTAV